MVGRAKAEGLYLTGSAVSFHTKRNQGYNEHDNLGLGLEYQTAPDWRVAAGFYKNSFYHEATYAEAIYTPFKLGRWEFGSSFGVITGYEHSPMLAAIPTAIYERGAWGMNVLVLPPFPGSVGVASVQLKWRFR